MRKCMRTTTSPRAHSVNLSGERFSAERICGERLFGERLEGKKAQQVVYEE